MELKVFGNIRQILIGKNTFLFGGGQMMKITTKRQPNELIRLPFVYNLTAKFILSGLTIIF
jgi:hypothetical protein